MQKILKLIVAIIIIFLIVFLFWWFLKPFPWRLPSAETTITSLSTEDYKVAAIGEIHFNYFFPFMLTKNATVNWYSVVPATAKFTGCAKKENTQISFIPIDTNSLAASILSIDAVGGLQCSKKNKCYYKNIRILADEVNCLDLVTNTFSPCSESKTQMYYSRYSDIKMQYVIYCCETKHCLNLDNRLVPLEKKVIKIKQATSNP